MAGLGELSLVLLKNALSLGLGCLGLLDAALDRLAALFQSLVDVREQLLREDEEDDGEGDQADDELGDRREQGVLRLLGRQLYQGFTSVTFRRMGLVVARNVTCRRRTA